MKEVEELKGQALRFSQLQENNPSDEVGVDANLLKLISSLSLTAND